MDNLIGKTISHYRILEHIGQGGMGVVYKAEDTRLERIVALKFLPGDSTYDSEARQRFAAEAHAASALEHQGICTIYDIDQTRDGELFICMAYYSGETLKEKIKRGALPIAEAIDIATKIKEALAAAHQAGIIHRDMKPSNIIITKRGDIKIIDFGLSKLVGKKSITKSGATLGTIDYMSPEHVCGEAIDQRTDIWALGVIVYEMLTGKSPFQGDHEVATIYSIVNEEAEPISGLRTGAPIELERIVNKCLKKEPAERYHHMDDLIADFSTLNKEFKGNSTSSRPRKQAARGVPIFKRKLVLLGTLSFVAVLAVLGRMILVPSKSPSLNDKSIAVLPFDDLNPEKDTDYFCAGITEDIRTQLSKIGEMVVISKAAMQRYKDKDKTPREIGSELKVATLLTGSIRRAGNQLRISCQLIDAGTEAQIWAETYDREMKDIFAIQSNVAKQIAKVLKAALSPLEKAEIEKVPTANLTAYEYFLKGSEYNRRWADGEKQDNVEAITHFKKAIALDPEYALAWAGLGYAYNISTYYGLGESWRDSAIVVCKKAVTLDPNCGYGYEILGVVSYFRGRYTEAYDFYLKAPDANPSMLFYVTGRLVEAVQASRKMISRDPLDHFGYLMLGNTYRLLDDPIQAGQWLNKAVELKSYPQTIFYDALLNLSRNRDDLASEQMNEIMAMEGAPTALFKAAVIARFLGDFSLAKELYEKISSTSVRAGFILLKTGQLEEAEKLFEQNLISIPNKIERGNEGADLRLQMANLQAIRGDKAEACEWLQQAIDVGFLAYRLALRDPLWENLHGEVRFQELMAQMKTKVDSMRSLVEELE